MSETRKEITRIECDGCDLFHEFDSNSMDDGQWTRLWLGSKGERNKERLTSEFVFCGPCVERLEDFLNEMRLNMPWKQAVA